jgi:hypothetical protein
MSAPDVSWYDPGNSLTAPKFDTSGTPPLFLMPASTYAPATPSYIPSAATLNAPSAPSAPSSGGGWATSLNALAGFGTSVANAFSSSYRSVNPVPRANVNLPTSSLFSSNATGTSSGMGQILMLILVGIALVFGLKHFRR